MHNVKFTLGNIISYRVTEEYNLVPTPIYNISMQHTANNPQQQMSTTIAGDDTAITYEEVINVGGNSQVQVSVTLQQKVSWELMFNANETS